ncbi:MAG: hypothetical protein NT144_06900 [Bacteroidia bacterium]|nr:hypothetical protein [Bacteroidia bacterium]
MRNILFKIFNHAVVVNNDYSYILFTFNPFGISNLIISTFEIEIDRLVYELYGLSEEEVRIVEGKV